MLARNLSIVVVAGLALSLMAGCGPGKVSETLNQGKKNVFRYPLVTNPTSLDPAKVQDGDTIDFLQQIYEGLVIWGTNNEPVPGLAEKWEISPDGKVYTFHIRKGAKFHNGREVEAGDFKYAIERSCDPKIASPTAENYLDDIDGALEKLKGKAKDVKGVEVVDKATLKITLKAPRAYFLSKMTYATAYAIAKEAVGEGEITTTAQMVGTGPYKIEKFDPNQLVVMAANKDYYGGQVKIDKIERPIILDGATRLNKYKAGEVDLVQLERQDIKGLEEDPKFKDHLKKFDRPAIWYVGFNVKNYKPFADIRVRQAFSMAIDRENIVNKILGGVNKVANGILPPGVMGHRDNASVPKFDVAKAKALLAEAGYPDGKGLPTLEMNYRAGRPDIRLVVEACVSDLKNNLGVNAQPREQEWAAYLQQHNKKDHNFFHMRWAADYLDPQNFLSLLLTTGGNENKTYYSNPKADALCAAADQEQSREKRIEMYAQAEDLILADCAWIPIYFQRDAELINPRVKGLRESLFGHLPHATVTLE